jgi:REP element-mobilizing transposase RayT
MPNTYTSLHCHIVFSTKRRQPDLTEAIRDRAWAYIGGIARDNEMTAVAVGGMSDHVHVLLLMKPTQTISKAVQLIKGGTSHWIHETFDGLPHFAWQDGYGAFSISREHTDEVAEYIRKKTFQEEYVEFLRKYGIEFDNRYIWD